ncbi:MAG TPA: LysR substrate-binding domain-containing protein [Alphaproteobacteria bacterium]|nr:LysR substrate-binding domain-containing protein [Alphaproteobacteria bacterium]
MDASDLRVFEAVARLGGMNRAAAELNTVQSNVTARIRALEDELGTPLFHRHARGVDITDAGRRLLPYAARVRVTLQEARRAVADAGTPAGPLTIGSLETTAALRLSPLLAGYARSYPDVDLIIRTGTTCELIQQVLDSQLEGAFVCGPVEHAELEAESVFREELALLTAPELRSIDEALARRDLRIVVLRAGCSYRERLEAILARRGITATRMLEFGTLEAIVGCVGAGLGVTLLPRSLIGPVWSAARVAVHALPAAEAMVQTVLIRRRDAFLSSALAAFLAQARPALTRAAAE